MEKIIEHHPTWDVYNYWCWGNESAFVRSFKTKREAEAYIAAKGKPFKGFEGLGIQEPRDIVQLEDGSIIFKFYN